MARKGKTIDRITHLRRLLESQGRRHRQPGANHEAQSEMSLYNLASLGNH